MTGLELDLLEALIPRGVANACSVSDLCLMTGMSDRTVRDGLERLLTERRFPVCTLPQPRGVFAAVTPAECQDADRNLKARAMSILRRRRALRLAGERLEYRETLFDL